VTASRGDCPLAAVLLDLDGTLVDTEPVWLEEEQALAVAHGGGWTAQQHLASVGRPLPESAERLRDTIGIPMEVDQVVEHLLDAVAARVREHTPWRPGARELLDALQEAGVPRGLVTMSYRPLAEAVLAALPADTFQAVVTGDEVTRAKPDPEPYLTACDRLGVEPRGCVVVEDSPSGVGSGLAAGCAVIAVPHQVAIEPAAGLTIVTSLTALDVERLESLVATAR
jgi:HAD superfamily hydrolase (TIGR01509 family)